MVELVRTGTADVVVARHYDRLYRTTRDLVELVDLTEETGVHLAAAQAQGVPGLGDYFGSSGWLRARRTAAQAPADGLALGLSRYAETVGSPAR
ncbi:recombinase family protein [Streptomyces sp. NPDC001315]|uniref:recombinase family protein n=1 Tax=Streptomyces sp. NPDC001315 TaxID=3364562 RepID=UPI00367C0552